MYYTYYKWFFYTGAANQIYPGGGKNLGAREARAIFFLPPPEHFLPPPERGAKSAQGGGKNSPCLKQNHRAFQDVQATTKFQ